MLTKILLGLGVLSNIATLIGFWMTYLTAPESVQSKVSHLLIIGGAATSVVLYAFILYRIMHKKMPSDGAISTDSEIRQLREGVEIQKSAAASATAYSRRLEEQLKEATQPKKDDALSEVLKEIATKDLEKLNDRIQRISQRIEFHFGHGADPSLDVVTELWNGSVFDLVNFGEISGHATYASRQLAGDPRIIDSVEPIIVNLRHGEKVTFTVRQYLSIEMADIMQANRDRQIAIDFENVSVTFKMAPFPGFSNQSFRWFGPRFAIEDATRI